MKTGGPSSRGGKSTPPVAEQHYHHPQQQQQPPPATLQESLIAYNYDQLRSQHATGPRQHQRQRTENSSPPNETTLHPSEVWEKFAELNFQMDAEGAFFEVLSSLATLPELPIPPKTSWLWSQLTSLNTTAPPIEKEVEHEWWTGTRLIGGLLTKMSSSEAHVCVSQALAFSSSNDDHEDFDQDRYEAEKDDQDEEGQTSSKRSKTYLYLCLLTCAWILRQRPRPLPKKWRRWQSMLCETIAMYQRYILQQHQDEYAEEPSLQDCHNSTELWLQHIMPACRHVQKELPTTSDATHVAILSGIVGTTSALVKQNVSVGRESNDPLEYLKGIGPTVAYRYEKWTWCHPWRVYSCTKRFSSSSDDDPYYSFGDDGDYYEQQHNIRTIGERTDYLIHKSDLGWWATGTRQRYHDIVAGMNTSWDDVGLAYMASVGFDFRPLVLSWEHQWNLWFPHIPTLMLEGTYEPKFYIAGFTLLQKLLQIIPEHVLEWNNNWVVVKRSTHSGSTEITAPQHLHPSSPIGTFQLLTNGVVSASQQERQQNFPTIDAPTLVSYLKLLLSKYNPITQVKVVQTLVQDNPHEGLTPKLLDLLRPIVGSFGVEEVLWTFLSKFILEMVECFSAVGELRDKDKLLHNTEVYVSVVTMLQLYLMVKYIIPTRVDMEGLFLFYDSLKKTLEAWKTANQDAAAQEGLSVAGGSGDAVPYPEQEYYRLYLLEGALQQTVSTAEDIQNMIAGISAKVASKEDEDVSGDDDDEDSILASSVVSGTSKKKMGSNSIAQSDDCIVPESSSLKQQEESKKKVTPFGPEPPPLSAAEIPSSGASIRVYPVGEKPDSASPVSPKNIASSGASIRVYPDDSERSIPFASKLQSSSEHIPSSGASIRVYPADNRARMVPRRRSFDVRQSSQPVPPVPGSGASVRVYPGDAEAEPFASKLQASSGAMPSSSASVRVYPVEEAFSPTQKAQRRRSFDVRQSSQPVPPIPGTSSGSSVRVYPGGDEPAPFASKLQASSETVPSSSESVRVYPADEAAPLDPPTRKAQRRKSFDVRHPPANSGATGRVDSGSDESAPFASKLQANSEAMPSSSASVRVYPVGHDRPTSVQKERRQSYSGASGVNGTARSASKLSATVLASHNAEQEKQVKRPSVTGGSYTTNTTEVNRNNMNGDPLRQSGHRRRPSATGGSYAANAPSKNTDPLKQSGHRRRPSAVGGNYATNTTSKNGDALKQSGHRRQPSATNGGDIASSMTEVQQQNQHQTQGQSKPINTCGNHHSLRRRSLSGEMHPSITNVPPPATGSQHHAQDKELSKSHHGSYHAMDNTGRSARNHVEDEGRQLSQSHHGAFNNNKSTTPPTSTSVVDQTIKATTTTATTTTASSRGGREVPSSSTSNRGTLMKHRQRGIVRRRPSGSGGIDNQQMHQSNHEKYSGTSTFQQRERRMPSSAATTGGGVQPRNDAAPQAAEGASVAYAPRREQQQQQQQQQPRRSGRRYSTS